VTPDASRTWRNRRRRRGTRGVTAVAAAAALACSTIALIGCTAGGGQAAAATTIAACPWVGSSASLSARVAEVLARMTLDDKLAMVDGTGFSTGTAGYVGHIAANPRLCVPGLNLEDGPQGGVPGVTQLPAPVALAAAFDPTLARAYGSVVGSEEHGKGADVNLGPTVNIVRDPRWGRAFESYGEDPYLSGQTAVGFIDGVQRQDVMSQVKHYAVYNQETNRNTSADDVVVSQRAMQEIYLPQFYAAVKQGGAASVMCSYSTISGQYACQNSAALGILEKQWDFPGFVTTDWGATHSSIPSALAGLDMSMPGGTLLGPDYYGAPLKAAVQDGKVPVSTLNDMVSPILLEMFRFGLFEHPQTGSLTDTVTTPAHAQTGQDVAEAGTVLLKDDGGVLPLTARSGQSVAVIGSDAGRYALTSGGGSAGVVAPYTVTPVQGIIQRAAADGVSVTYAQGDVPAQGALSAVPASAFSQAVAAAKKAAVAVVFASNFETEGADLTTISLPANENQLISAVAAANPNTVVVLNTGSAATMPWLSRVKAVIEAWYPGQDDGNAIAAVLFGDVNPSGKLPVTFPQSLTEVPASTAAQWPGTGGKVQYSEGVLVGYRWYSTKGITPLFPFGYGLSYTSFAFSHLAVRHDRGGYQVSAEVTNTGKRAGSDVAQLYVSDAAATGEPAEQLKGYQRVTLRPGETTRVTFTVSRDDFAWWNGRWEVTPGSYALMVGDSSASLPLTARVAVEGA
jgi:beta-glucosidase